MTGLSIREKCAIRFRAIREDRGLKQVDVANALGVTKQQASLLESPISNPTIESIQRAADALGVTVAEFFADDAFAEFGDEARHAAYPAPPGPNASIAAYVVAPDETEAVLAALQGDPKATASSIGRATGLGTNKVSHALSRLKAQGRIRREGSKKAGHWVVVDVSPDDLAGPDI